MTAIFGTALARSGGGLFSHVVSAHPDAMLARHPFLEVFRSLRNAVVRATRDGEIAAAVPPSAPLQDGYFSAPKRRLLDAVLDANFDLAFEDDPAAFVAAAAARCEHESPDLAPHFERLPGASYQAVLDNGLDLIGDVRGVGDRRWLGFQDPWVLDWFPALSRAHPDARFLVLLRDPRAVVGSMKGIARTDPDQVVNTVSYARHWRKYVALVVHLLADPHIGPRLHVVGYEHLLREPGAVAAGIARFLDLPPDDRMTDAERFVDWGTGTTWSGNSSFGTEAGTIDATAAERWRRTLDPDVQRLVEWLCGPDMRLAGYEPDDDDDDAAALRTLVRESGEYSHWRSDEGDVVVDAGAELLRRSLLRDAGPIDDELTGRCFLFPEVRDRLLEPGRPLLAPLAASKR